MQQVSDVNVESTLSMFTSSPITLEIVGKSLEQFRFRLQFLVGQHSQKLFGCAEVNS